MRAVVRYENNDIDRAFADANESLRLDPRCASAWMRRGFLLECRNRFDLALADAEQAIRLDPKSSYAYMGRGIFYFGTDAFEKAMSDFDQAGRLNSRAAMPHVWRGIIHLRTKKWGLAIAEFKQALEIDREDLDTSLLLATAYVFQSDFGKAIPMISQVIAADPHFGGAYELRAVCSISRGKYGDALHDLDESVRVEPDSPGHLALRSRLRFEMEQYKQSLADLEASLQLDPSHAETHRSLSWFLAFCPDRTLRDAKRAVNAAVLSCELTGWKKPSNLAALAAVDSEVGDFDGAAKWQQKAIDGAGGERSGEARVPQGFDAVSSAEAVSSPGVIRGDEAFDSRSFCEEWRGGPRRVSCSQMPKQGAETRSFLVPHSSSGAMSTTTGGDLPPMPRLAMMSAETITEACSGTTGRSGSCP